MVFALAKMIIRRVTPSRGFSSGFSEDDHQTSANGAAANAPPLVGVTINRESANSAK
jgi:hypothetical protein